MGRCRGGPSRLAQMRELAVETRKRLLPGRSKPFLRTHENSDALASQLTRSRNSCSRLNWVFHGADKNGIFRDKDDDASCGQIDNDFLAGFFVGLLGKGWEGKAQK